MSSNTNVIVGVVVERDKWFSYDEIVAMKSEIRNEVLMLGTINNIKNGLVTSLDIVSQY